MSDQVVAGASVDPLKSVADALETAVQAARDGAADARSAVDKAIPAASRFLARFIYTTSYTFSYGVVFPAVLVAKSIPADNALRSRICRWGARGDRHGRPVDQQPDRHDQH